MRENCTHGSEGGGGEGESSSQPPIYLKFKRRDAATTSTQRINTMGNRLTQIATRTGDNGTTGLGDNTRVSKNNLRIHAMGDVDELNSHIGLLLCETLQDEIRVLLIDIQHQLFNLGGELSIPGSFEMPGLALLKPETVSVLDAALVHFNETLPALQEFILPGGTRAAAQAHVCRTVARRAERSVVALEAQEPANDTYRHYLNRLSDLMFVLARTFNRTQDSPVDEVCWHSQRMADDKASSVILPEDD